MTDAGMGRLSTSFGEAYDPAAGLPHSLTPETLRDLAAGRLSAMDAAGIDMQVLSALATQTLPLDSATQLIQTCNDRLAVAFAEHPDRFAGFRRPPHRET
jgi:predicted TIM-barrel fold metal-dependent hydrolase